MSTSKMLSSILILPSAPSSMSHSELCKYFYKTVKKKLCRQIQIFLDGSQCLRVYPVTHSWLLGSLGMKVGSLSRGTAGLIINSALILVCEEGPHIPLTSTPAPTLSSS